MYIRANMYLYVYEQIKRTTRMLNCVLKQQKQSSSLLPCVALCCSVLLEFAVHCSAMQCVAVRCSVLQCVAVRCSALQCVAVRCSALQSFLR